MTQRSASSDESVSSVMVASSSATYSSSDRSLSSLSLSPRARRFSAMWASDRFRAYKMSLTLPTLSKR